MVMEAAKTLRRSGDWIVELRTILGQGPARTRDRGARPESEHRSTKKAVSSLLSNLRLSKAQDKYTTQQDIDMVVLNAVDLLIQDKVDKSKKDKTKFDALAKFEKEVNDQFVAEANKKQPLDNEWKEKIKQAVRSLRQEERERVVDDANESKEFREQCLGEMCGSQEGKLALQSDSGLAKRVLPMAKKQDLAVAALSAVNWQAIDKFDFDAAYGDKKDDIIAEAIMQSAKNDGNPERHFHLAKKLDPARLKTVLSNMLTSDEGKQLLADNPSLAGAVISSVDPATLKKYDFAAAFGAAKNDVLAASLQAIASKPVAADKKIDRNSQLDPELFTLLAKKLSTQQWNDKNVASGPRKGLAPRVFAKLLEKGNYKQICELVEAGVDTKAAANTDGAKGGAGFYSGFVQPLQHLIQPTLRDTSLVGTKAAKNWDQARTSKAEGAKLVLAALKKNNVADTASKWEEIKGGEWMKDFEKDPGTIWGFESVRMPYVQAGHESDKGIQPLRMLELWDAVRQGLSYDAYVKLMSNPTVEIKKIVDSAAKTVEGQIDNQEKYAEIKRDKVQYMKKFREAATNYLNEFVSQMPKGQFVRGGLEAADHVRQKVEGQPRDSTPIKVSEVTGIHYDKYMNSFACKAGLWWAKQEKKPVYYCLDGLNMDDATNYKEVKNKAIKAYLDGGGATSDSASYQEVVTLVEVREILKNWDGEDGLNKTVKFVRLGKVLSSKETEKEVKKWQDQMKAANDRAGRRPAPPRDAFAKDLGAIDPGLMASLQNGPEGDMDARDIVKKYGYLVKIANTRPRIVLNYIVNRCQVLIDNGLLTDGLADAAKAHFKAVDEGVKKKIDAAARTLQGEIGNCHKDFRPPLSKALVDYRLTAQKPKQDAKPKAKAEPKPKAKAKVTT
jgi:hypothetical protein